MVLINYGSEPNSTYSVPRALTWALISEPGIPPPSSASSFPPPSPALASSPSSVPPLGLCLSCAQCWHALSPSPTLFWSGEGLLTSDLSFPGLPRPSPGQGPPICSNALSCSSGYLVGFVRVGTGLFGHCAVCCPQPSAQCHTSSGMNE